MKISVITATFNSENTVRDTIESLLAQDYRDVEYIVVDGNSSDDTMKIVNEYSEHFKYPLKWISEPDNGIYDAMNKGIAMATGDVIGLLNSDDFYSSSNILSTVAKEIRDVDAIYGDIIYVNPDNIAVPVRSYSSKEFRRWMMRLGFMPAHPSFYCRKEAYRKFGLFDTSFNVAADFEQLLRLIYVNRISTKYVPMNFVTMRTGGLSSSGFSSHKKILRDHLRAYKKNNVKSNIFFESLRYIYRIGEILKFKLTHL